MSWNSVPGTPDLAKGDGVHYPSDQILKLPTSASAAQATSTIREERNQNRPIYASRSYSPRYGLGPHALTRPHLGAAGSVRESSYWGSAGFSATLALQGCGGNGRDGMIYMHAASMRGV